MIDCSFNVLTKTKKSKLMLSIAVTSNVQENYSALLIWQRFYSNYLNRLTRLEDRKVNRFAGSKVRSSTAVGSSWSCSWNCSPSWESPGSESAFTSSFTATTIRWNTATSIWRWNAIKDYISFKKTKNGGTFLSYFNILFLVND